MSEINFDEFLKVDMRVGKIIKAEAFERAKKPAYKLWLDFGELGQKQSSAQITKYYSCEELIGRLIVAVVNFPPKSIAGFKSEVLVMGSEHDGGVLLLSADAGSVPGSRVF
ncbi:MAG: tRNA-binding protein [Candidatus Obscuribacterales bacterium]|nr:tRNA-binding protein [Candidatus Obscuribacterales bacterium]